MGTKYLRIRTLETLCQMIGQVRCELPKFLLYRCHTKKCWKNFPNSYTTRMYHKSLSYGIPAKTRQQPKLNSPTEEAFFSFRHLSQTVSFLRPWHATRDASCCESLVYTRRLWHCATVNRDQIHLPMRFVLVARVHAPRAGRIEQFA